MGILEPLGGKAEAPVEKLVDVLFGSSKTPLVLLDREFNFIRVNEAYAAACKRPMEDFPGRNHFELYPSDARLVFEQVVLSRQPSRVKARPFAFPDHPEWGVTYWDWLVTPLLDRDREVEALVFALEDVTERETKDNPARSARLGWLIGRGLFTRRHALPVFLLSSLVQVVIFVIVDALGNPSRYLGIPGAATALVGVLAAISAGPALGLAVSAVGGLAYLVFLADFGAFVSWPAIVISIVLWMSAAASAGFAGEWVRRRAQERETLLSYAVNERGELVDSLKRSEGQLRHIAETLQRGLLDVSTGLSDVEVGHLHRSATDGAQLGGDFYDVFGLGERKTAVLIGDVSGKGIGAVSQASLVKNAAKAFAHLNDSPASVLTHVNQLLLEASREGGFTTAFFGILDEPACLLTFASAGHPPPLVKRHDRVDVLDHAACVLGVFPGVAYKNRHVSVRDGEILLLYTDGLTEARDRAGQLFGEERLVSWLQTHSFASCGELSARLFEEVVAFSDGKLSDDAAVLAVMPTGVRS